jgi:CubicO group peptidase (beta-lactamase class C family)
MLAVALVALAAFTTADDLPVKPAKDVGMSKARLEVVDRIVKRGIRGGGYPGAAVVVGREGAAVLKRGYGKMTWGSKGTPVSADQTIYDLASLSKVIGTTTAVMVLYDQGKISLNAPVSQYLPEFSGGLKDQVTVQQLLTHRSGLPAYRELWRHTRNSEEARRLILSTSLQAPPGTQYEYSDLGADILGMMIERVAGEGLDTFLQKKVFGPLGMKNTFYLPPDSLRHRIAPTDAAAGSRGGMIRGVVHDENAYILGGVAGHAGLFSTATDLAVFAQMMLNGGEYSGIRILSDSTVQLFTRRAAGHRALGWDTADDDGKFGAGKYLTERAYGHTGFTGTSIWIDPEREMFMILLTNRVYEAKARRPKKVIADIRSDLSDAAVLAVVDSPDGVLKMPTAFRADLAKGWNPKKKAVKRGKRGKSSKKVTK